MITVLMPVFNGERWLGNSVPSILNQTFRDFELLIINDGSTDSTSNILEKYARNDPRIRVLTQCNQGIVPTMNTGLQQATYGWIARIDADDLAYPKRLERQWEFVQRHSRLAVAASFAHYINDRGAIIGETRNPFTCEDRVQDQIASGRMVYFIHSTILMKRDVVLEAGGYREQFPLSHDTDLWNRVADQGYLTLAQQEVLGAYRIHEQGMTRNSFETLAEELRWMDLCARQRRRGRPEPTLQQFRAAMANTSFTRRVNVWRQDTAFTAYKSATVAHARGDRPAMIRDLALSAMLNPAPVAQNIWRKSIEPRYSRLVGSEKS